MKFINMPLSEKEKRMIRECNDDREEQPQDKRHPNDFDVWPSNEQMSSFVRGGR